RRSPSLHTPLQPPSKDATPLSHAWSRSDLRARRRARDRVRQRCRRNHFEEPRSLHRGSGGTPRLQPERQQIASSSFDQRNELRDIFPRRSSLVANAVLTESTCASRDFFSASHS